jgi:hypothetical protein
VIYRKLNHPWEIGHGEIKGMSGRKAATVREKEWIVDISHDEGTVHPSFSKKAKVSYVTLTLEPLISEPEPMGTTSTGKGWVAKPTVDTMGRILYNVDWDQCASDLY